MIMSMPVLWRLSMQRGRNLKKRVYAFLMQIAASGCLIESTQPCALVADGVKFHRAKPYRGYGGGEFGL